MWRKIGQNVFCGEKWETLAKDLRGKIKESGEWWMGGAVSVKSLRLQLLLMCKSFLGGCIGESYSRRLYRGVLFWEGCIGGSYSGRAV